MIPSAFELNTSFGKFHIEKDIVVFSDDVLFLGQFQEGRGQNQFHHTHCVRIVVPVNN